MISLRFFIYLFGTKIYWFLSNTWSLKTIKFLESYFFFWFNKPVSDETTSSKKVKWQSEHKSILFLVVSIDVA